MKPLVALAFTAITLTGCVTSNVNDEWECPYVDGDGTCKSIASIHERIIQAGSAPNANYLGIGNGQVGGDIKVAHGAPVWKPDQIMKIWISPYIDESNIYHEKSVIYKVVRPAGWAVLAE